MSARRWSRSLAQLASHPAVLDLVLLAATVWLAHFYHFRSLGLYEDDYTHTSPALGWNAGEAARWVLASLTSWDLGRPLGYALGAILSFLGAQLGGLPGMYVLAFVVHALNAGLFYSLLKRIGQRGIGLIGGVLFALFPADTTHPFLMHSFGLHTSLTFLLLASHAYLSGRKVSAYVLALCCLLIYETPYGVFLGIPIVLLPWDRNLPRQLLRHAGIWLAVLAMVVAIRFAMGEGRIEALGPGSGQLTTIMGHTLNALVIGPAVSIPQFWRGPQWAIAHRNPELTAVFLGSMGLFALMLARLRGESISGEPAVSIALPVRTRGQRDRLRASIPHPQTFKMIEGVYPVQR